jgi:hypothetical protein
MVASRPGSPYIGRPTSSNSTHTKVEEELHELAGIDYDKVDRSFTYIKKKPFINFLHFIRSPSSATLPLPSFTKKP